MEKFIAQTEKYTIWQIGAENLYELADFVVRENYKHHVGHYTSEDIQNEIALVYQEELLYADTSIVFLVRDLEGRTIGSIRIFKWDRHQTLPHPETLWHQPAYFHSCRRRVQLLAHRSFCHRLLCGNLHPHPF